MAMIQLSVYIKLCGSKNITKKWSELFLFRIAIIRKQLQFQVKIPLCTPDMHSIGTHFSRMSFLHMGNITRLRNFMWFR